MKRILLALSLLLASVGGAAAQNCAGFPFTLTNGTTADATQVMADFNLLLTCANTSLAHNGNNSDITSLSSLTTPLSVSQGGTATTTMTLNGVLIGQGAVAPLFLRPSAAGTLLGSNDGTAWTSTNSPAGPLGVNRNPTTERFEVAGAIKTTNSGANFNAGGPGAVMDYDSGTGRARFGLANGGGTATSTVILGQNSALVAFFQAGVQVDSPTGGDKGTGSINTSAQHYQNGSPISAAMWISYNGSAPAINASFNVTSVTKNGTGDYTINFTTPFTTANFSCVASSTIVTFQTSKAQGNVRITTFTLTGASTFAAGDTTDLNVACFGQQ